MRLEIADTLPVAPRDLARHYRERRLKLHGGIRLTPKPTPFVIHKDDPTPDLNQGLVGWSFGQFHRVGAVVKLDLRPMEVHRIVRAAAQHKKISVADILSGSRFDILVKTRQLIMYLSRVKIQASLPAIGRALGGRDHTTISHGLKAMAKELEKNPTAVRADLDAIWAIAQGAEW